MVLVLVGLGSNGADADVGRSDRSISGHDGGGGAAGGGGGGKVMVVLE